MNYTCPKCGKKMDLSVEALIDSQYKVTCPECRSELQIVGDYASGKSSFHFRELM